MLENLLISLADQSSAREIEFVKLGTRHIFSVGGAPLVDSEFLSGC